MCNSRRFLLTVHCTVFVLFNMTNKIGHTGMHSTIFPHVITNEKQLTVSVLVLYGVKINMPSTIPFITFCLIRKKILYVHTDTFKSPKINEHLQIPHRYTNIPALHIYCVHRNTHTPLWSLSLSFSHLHTHVRLRVRHLHDLSLSLTHTLSPFTIHLMIDATNDVP